MSRTRGTPPRSFTQFMWAARGTGRRPTMAKVFPGLLDAQQKASRALDVLTSAIEQLKPPKNGETLEDLAVRLRGSAVLAATACIELSAVSGFHEAAHEAASEGLLGT